jgi:hypothetical protein
MRYHFHGADMRCHESRKSNTEISSSSVDAEESEDWNSGSEKIVSSWIGSRRKLWALRLKGIWGKCGEDEGTEWSGCADGYEM